MSVRASSAAWGETVGSCVALAYIWRPDGQVVTLDYLDAGDYEVSVGGLRYPVTVRRTAPHDPANGHVRA